MTASEIDPRTPVLVGVGICDQRTDDASAAHEPIALMIDAVRAAGVDSGSPSILPTVERVSVPIGRWSYGNPGRMIAAAIGATKARTISAAPGVSQQTILSEACSAIATGEIEAALIAAGEAGHRMLRARIDGVELVDTENHDVPDVVLEPSGTIIGRHEIDGGLGVMPVAYYALIDHAWRHAKGLSVDTRRRVLAERYSAYSRIAVANPHGWDRVELTLDDVLHARQIAFPYGKHHVSNWSVDQSTALLLTSVGHATEHGVPRDRWVFPQVFTESNHPVEVSARRNMHRCEGAELAAAALLDAAGCTADDLDLAEFYTCFPVAVDVFAEAIGFDLARPTSFTGAMPFAGGPFNNFALHSMAQLAEHLRARRGSRGLVTAVSGVLTKYGFSLWGTEPNVNGYQFIDVTQAARATTPVCEIDAVYAGPAKTVSYTVTFSKTGTQSGIVVVDTPAGDRRVVATTAPELMARMQVEEFCGRSVFVTGDTFTLDSDR